MNSSSETDKTKLDKIKSKDILKKLKGNYFLQKVFNNLMRKKLLDIIKYNKNIKKRINITIKDYKEYADLYSSIEIEIKPVDNKYYKFINIRNGDEKYFHIYFNNIQEETKRNYIMKNEIVIKLKIIINYQIKSFERLFENCECIEYMHFTKFYRNNITNMGNMFNGCSSLKELNLSNFNTINVTDMRYMFYNCSSLKELNLSNFNTNNVTNMRCMFYKCYSLKELNLSNFNTNNATDIGLMFSRCSYQLRNKISTQYKNLKNAFNF